MVYLDGSSEVLGHRSWAHHTGNFVDVLQSDVSSVLDVLLLLSIARRLVQVLDDQGSRAGHDLDLSLTVGHDELHSHTKTLVV